MGTGAQLSSTGVVGDFQLVGQANGHDVVVDPFADKTFVIQGGAPDSDLEHGCAPDVQVHVAGCRSSHVLFVVDFLVAEVFLIRLWREALGHCACVIQEIDFNAIDECRDSRSGFVARVDRVHFGLGERVHCRHGH